MTFEPVIPEADHAKIAAEYAVGGVSQQTIADRYGVTRQAISFLLCHRFPEALAQRKVDRLHAAGLRENARLKWRACKACGRVVVMVRAQKYCTPDHERLARVTQFWWDEDARERHHRAVAKWTLDNPEKTTIELRRHAERFLAGESKSYVRSFVEGSKVHQVAQMMFEEGWPLADRFPDELRARLAAEGACDDCVRGGRNEYGDDK